MPRITFTGSNRLVGNPATCLFGPNLGKHFDTLSLAALTTYFDVLMADRRRNFLRIPSALGYIHFKFLTQQMEIKGCEEVGEHHPAGWDVDYIEDGDYQGWQGWGR